MKPEVRNPKCEYSTPWRAAPYSIRASAFSFRFSGFGLPSVSDFGVLISYYGTYPDH